MLTKTRRQLERDGLVMRRAHAMVPPRVDYSLKPIGEKLGESVCGVWLCVEAHMDEMQRARRKYDKARQRSKKATSRSRESSLPDCWRTQQTPRSAIRRPLASRCTPSWQA